MYTYTIFQIYLHFYVMQVGMFICNLNKNVYCLFYQLSETLDKLKPSLILTLVSKNYFNFVLNYKTPDMSILYLLKNKIENRLIFKLFTIFIYLWIK